jgi:hypothetical protein
MARAVAGFAFDCILRLAMVATSFLIGCNAISLMPGQKRSD